MTKEGRDQMDSETPLDIQLSKNFYDAMKDEIDKSAQEVKISRNLQGK